MSEKKLTSRSLGAGPAGPDAAPMPAGGEGIRARGAMTKGDDVTDKRAGSGSERSAHTPGPWEVWAGHLTVVAGPAKVNTRGRIGGHRKTICELEDPEDDFDEDDDLGAAREEAEDNARLIAAAPDLLAALRDLLSSHAAIYRAGKACHDSNPVVVAALAAIAKAEGRQP